MTDLVALQRAGAERLAKAGIDSARADARVLLAHAQMQASGSGVETVFEALISRRANHEPVAYITGVREFWSLEFEIGPGVLIPRPETETLVEEAIRAFPDRVAVLDILDLGTGTACLPIAFLSEYPNARAVAVDASPAALSWARRNLDKHRLLQRCTLRESQWTDGLSGMFDIIFSNPPYIDCPTLDTLEPDIITFEPKVALDGGPDGLAAYRELAPRIVAHLKQNGRAFVELGAGQASAVRDIFAAAGLETKRVVTDLSGVDRCLVAARTATAGNPSQKTVGKRSLSR